jgi:hypothetical protein
MAAREKSIFRISLLSDGTTCACEDAHRASVDVLFVGQAGAIQGQLESSTEFRSKCRLCRQSEGEKCSGLPSLFLGEDSD